MAFGALVTCPLDLHAQERYSIPADPNFKYSSPIAPGVAVPDKIETSIGTLNVNYGYPDDATTQKAPSVSSQYFCLRTCTILHKPDDHRFAQWLRVPFAEAGGTQKSCWRRPSAGCFA